MRSRDEVELVASEEPLITVRVPRTEIAVKVATPLIYVSGPIRGKQTVDEHTMLYSEETARNVNGAMEVGYRLWELGLTPIIPHLSVHWHRYIVGTLEHAEFGEKKDLVWDDWLELDFSYLTVCDSLYRISMPSKGADMEVEWAQQMGKPVFYSIKDVASHYASLRRRR